jgi:L-ascorbate metabolism protein UlaG (beta-lactamase superfamily)
VYSQKDYKADASVVIKKEAFENIGYTEITWLAGTGFLINSRGFILIIDPVLKTLPDSPMISEAGIKMKIDYPIDAVDVPKTDVVLYTHSDDDHLGMETIKTISKHNPKIIGTFPTFEKLVRHEVSHELITVCRYGDIFQFGEISIDVVRADHPWQLQDPDRYGKPFRDADCVGFIVKTRDCTFFIPGDTRLMEEHLYVKDVDVLALDVSHCLYHLGTLGATILSNVLKDALLFPYHWGTYDDPDVPAHCGCPEEVYDNAVNKGRQRRFAPGVPLKMKDRREMK